jgi:Flp pilus assembly protein TadG
MKALQHFRSCQAGSTAVEFAIISTVLMLVPLGAIELGRGLNIRNQLSQAADYGARKILTDSQISDSALETTVRSAFIASTGGALKVTIGVETVNALQFRSITLTYPFTPLIPGLTSGQITLSVARRTPVV